MKFVSQLYTGWFLLFDRAKTYSDRVQVEYRLSFATVVRLFNVKHQSPRFHFKTFLVFVTSSYYILEMVDT